MSADVAAPARGAHLANSWLGFLPNAVVEPRSALRSILTGWPTAFLPSIVIATILGFFVPNAETPQFPFTGLTALFMLVVFAPVIETLIMGAVLLVLLRFVSPLAAIVISAAGWGIAHSLEAPIWGLVIWWPFLIFSTLFVVWLSRSRALAFAIPASVHALNNLLPAIPIAYPQLF